MSPVERSSNPQGINVSKSLQRELKPTPTEITTETLGVKSRLSPTGQRLGLREERALAIFESYEGQQLTREQLLFGMWGITNLDISYSRGLSRVLRGLRNKGYNIPALDENGMYRLIEDEK